MIDALCSSSFGLAIGCLLLGGVAGWGLRARRERALRGEARPPHPAERGEAAQAEFLAMISHELRTPLNAVLGASELLRTTALDADQADLVATSDLCGRQLLSLVDGLLDLSEIEGGRLHLSSQVFDVELELEEVLRMFVEAAQAKGLDIGLELDASCPDIVIGDPPRFREVLVALLANAVKFTDQGSIRIAVQLVGSGGRSIRIQVADTGCGMAPEVLERVFGGERVARRERMRDGSGSGFGVAVARALVHRMGGQIGAESEPGVGSTVWFELPNRRPSDLERQEFASTLPLRGRRVLLLTGSEELAARVTAQLLSQDCEVSLFSPTRAEDLAMAPDLGWDCVVVDADVATSVGGLWQRRMPPMVALGNRREMSGGELVRLPVYKGELLQAVLRACTRHDHQGESRGRGVRVLVADDNVVNRRMVEKMLEVAGCQVVLANDGAEAVRAWQGGGFDLVLMDYQMPVLDGPEAARQIRDLPGGLQVPIIAFTANNSTEVRHACTAAGMDGFLSKPLRFGELEQALATWVLRAETAT